MSAAASRLELESPSAVQKSLPAEEYEHEREVLEKLTVDTTRTSSVGPIIAVDLDDVLGRTNEAVAECKHLPLQRCTSSFIFRA
jgi:hypothetical protein